MQVAHSHIARTPLDLLPNAIQKAHPTAPFRTEPTFPWDGTNTLSKETAPGCSAWPPTVGRKNTREQLRHRTWELAPSSAPLQGEAC